MSVNRVFLLGRIGKDPEIKHTQSSSFCTFSLATSEKWKDKASGEMKEQTEWHNCVAFGKTAELVSNYVKKGSQVYIEGKLTTTKKDDKYFTNINVQSIQFLDIKKDNGGQQVDKYEQLKSKIDSETQAAKHDSFYDEIPF